VEDKIGLLGGTFDPIHIVHVFMGTLAREELGLGKVIFMPAGAPPHKVRGSITSARHRLAMAGLATQNESCFETSDIELTRDAPSYTIDTVRLLRRALEPHTQLYLIMGSDSLLELGTWKDHDELLSLVTLVVFPRPGHALEGPRVPKNCVVLSAEGVGFDLCSSAVRERVKKGRSIRYLVPSAVGEYITRHNLYRAG
jgi:nicotinate-nucleotide adenylyltransferase